MKLNDTFITHSTSDQHIMVTTGHTAFNGLVRSNKTAGFILESLKSDITKQDLIKKIFEKYDAPINVIESDVKKILDQLRAIGAIDD